jgi:uncharacterized membrane protein YeiH
MDLGPDFELTSDTLLDLLEILGTVAFAISGALAAVRARMDWFGVLLVGTIVAVGGGTVRDVLLGLLPVAWIRDGWPVPVAAGAALVTMLPAVRYHVSFKSARLAILVADAVGLATFAVVSSDIALGVGMSNWQSIAMGVVGATFGGILRDVVINERPVMLTGDFYALAAAVSAALHVAMVSWDVARGVSLWVAVVAGLALRSVALWRRWSVPTFEG